MAFPLEAERKGGQNILVCFSISCREERSRVRSEKSLSFVFSTLRREKSRRKHNLLAFPREAERKGRPRGPAAPQTHLRSQLHFTNCCHNSPPPRHHQHHNHQIKYFFKLIAPMISLFFIILILSTIFLRSLCVRSRIGDCHKVFTQKSSSKLHSPLSHVSDYAG